MDAEIEKIRAFEEENEYGLYQVAFAGWNETGPIEMTFAQLTFLMQDNGAFWIEQRKRNQNRNFRAVFRPGKDITVEFPKLEKVYRGPASLLDGPDAAEIRAAYEGLRIALGLSGYWKGNDSVRRSFGGKVTLAPADSPFHWVAKLDGGIAPVPISEIVCKRGLRDFMRIERQETSILQSRHADNKSLLSAATALSQGGQLWHISFPNSVRKNEISYSPLSTADVDIERVRRVLSQPLGDPSSVSSQLTLQMLKDWLNLT